MVDCRYIQGRTGKAGGTPLLEVDSVEVAFQRRVGQCIFGYLFRDLSENSRFEATVEKESVFEGCLVVLDRG